MLDAQREGSEGFTLLEVIVALAILSLTLGALMNVIGNGLRYTGKAGRLGEAALLAQALLAEVGPLRPIKSGATSGEFANGYRWRLIIDEYGNVSERRLWPVGAYTISAEVLWEDNREERSYALSTLRFGPKEMSQ